MELSIPGGTGGSLRRRAPLRGVVRPVLLSPPPIARDDDQAGQPAVGGSKGPAGPPDPDVASCQTEGSGRSGWEDGLAAGGDRWWGWDRRGPGPRSGAAGAAGHTTGAG